MVYVWCILMRNMIDRLTVDFDTPWVICYGKWPSQNSEFSMTKGDAP